MEITPAHQSLASKSLTAFKWNKIGRFISLFLQFTLGIILARALKITKHVGWATLLCPRLLSALKNEAVN